MAIKKRSKKSVKPMQRLRDVCVHQWNYMRKIYKCDDGIFIVRGCSLCHRKQYSIATEWAPLAALALNFDESRVIFQDIEDLLAR